MHKKGENTANVLSSFSILITFLLVMLKIKKKMKTCNYGHIGRTKEQILIIVIFGHTFYFIHSNIVTQL